MDFLLINPPIYDFAAYDLWAKPLGLLYLSSLLKQSGHNTRLLDCLDRKHPLMPETESNKWGCGHYPYSEIAKPEVLSKVPRKYKRYGLPKELILKALRKEPKPDTILVSSVMTYWYLGVFEIIKTVKEVFKDVPVALGGNYAMLCFNHAKEFSGADHVIEGSFSNLQELMGFSAESLKTPFELWPEPDYSQYKNLEHIAIRTTMGCPYNCSYCAVKVLAGNKWEKKPVNKVVDEIVLFSGKGVKNIAFYDDALLYEAHNHIIPVFRSIIEKGLKLNFHTPNGLHAKYITKEIAGLLKGSGFVMPRISLETASAKAQRETGGKVLTKEYLSAVKALVDSGYKKGEYCAYTMLGMPNQSIEEVGETLDLAHKSGAHISLGEYSPIPKTGDWGRIKDCMPSLDPLWTNNSLFPLHPLSDWPKLQGLKDKARQLNQKLRYSD